MTEDEIIQATVKQASEMHQSQTGPVPDRQVVLDMGVRRRSAFMGFYRATTRMASELHMHGLFLLQIFPPCTAVNKHANFSLRQKINAMNLIVVGVEDVAARLTPADRRRLATFATRAASLV